MLIVSEHEVDMRKTGSRRFAVVAALLALGVICAGTSRAQPGDRYFLSGDGLIHLSHEKSGRSAQVRYRLSDGSYPLAAQHQIDRLFGVPPGSEDHISLRFISLLDHFEDRFNHPIKLISGYRSPASNEKLRNQGRPAAKASLHMEGMAADIRLPGKLAAWAFERVKSMQCCGVGYYHGTSLHLDTGPARYWSESTSKVNTNISEDNKRIMVRTDKDIYRPGERIELRLGRITRYPLGLAAEVIVANADRVLETSVLDAQRGCRTVAAPSQRTASWTLPAGFRSSEKVQLRLHFCGKLYPEMPDQIDSNPVLILAE
jgi:uncharacterized protein YcbK (DUF882 family)